MIIRTRLGLVLTTVSLLAPVSLHAATELDAINACAKALADQIGDAQGSPVAYRISGDSSDSPALLSGITSFYIDAAAPQSGDIVARADCRVDATGEVKTLRQLNSTEARLLKQLSY